MTEIYYNPLITYPKIPNWNRKYIFISSKNILYQELLDGLTNKEMCGLELIEEGLGDEH